MKTNRINQYNIGWYAVILFVFLCILLGTIGASAEEVTSGSIISYALDVYDLDYIYEEYEAIDDVRTPQLEVYVGLDIVEIYTISPNEEILNVFIINTNDYADNVKVFDALHLTASIMYACYDDMSFYVGILEDNIGYYFTYLEFTEIMIETKCEFFKVYYTYRENLKALDALDFT